MMFLAAWVLGGCVTPQHTEPDPILIQPQGHLTPEVVIKTEENQESESIDTDLKGTALEAFFLAFSSTLKMHQCVDSPL